MAVPGGPKYKVSRALPWYELSMLLGPHATYTVGAGPAASVMVVVDVTVVLAVDWMLLISVDVSKKVRVCDDAGAGRTLVAVVTVVVWRLITVGVGPLTMETRVLVH